MVHRQGFMTMYMAHANMLVPGRARAPQSIKHVNTCRIHRETDDTWWHGSGRSNYSDYAHNVTWICTYSNWLKNILISQGPEHSWPKRVAHISTRVHHTKCTITHTHIGIYIYIYIYTHTSCIMLSHRAGKVIQTLPTFQEFGLARYRKCKTNIAIPKERGPSKKQEK